MNAYYLFLGILIMSALIVAYTPSSSIQNRFNDNSRFPTPREMRRISSHTPPMQASIFPRKNFTDERETLKYLPNRTIYYDYDSFELNPEYDDVLDHYANYLKRRKNIKVVIEGNTDETGNHDYNEWLGMKRANTIRHELMRRGIPSHRIEIFSNGEDSPKSLEHDEYAYQKNRRSDVLYFRHKIRNDD